MVVVLLPFPMDSAYQLGLISEVEGSFPSYTVLSENQEMFSAGQRQPHSNCVHKQDGMYCIDIALFISTTSGSSA